MSPQLAIYVHVTPKTDLHLCGICQGTNWCE